MTAITVIAFVTIMIAIIGIGYGLLDEESK